MSAANVTREGIEVKPGQVWLDLDKRMSGRKRSILAVSDGIALMTALGTSDHRTTRVKVARMHKGSTGWALASESTS